MWEHCYLVLLPHWNGNGDGNISNGAGTHLISTGWGQALSPRHSTLQFYDRTIVSCQCCTVMRGWYVQYLIIATVSLFYRDSILNKLCILSHLVIASYRTFLLLFVSLMLSIEFCIYQFMLLLNWSKYCDAFCTPRFWILPPIRTSGKQWASY